MTDQTDSASVSIAQSVALGVRHTVRDDGPVVEWAAYQEVFGDLDEFAKRNPPLRAFTEATSQLREQAQRLAAGATSTPRLSASSPKTFPDRALAEQVVAIVSKLPPIDDTQEDKATLTLVANLLGNLVIEMTGAIMATFPDAISHR